MLHEIDQKVNQQEMERALLEEGTLKFANPQKALINLIETKRAALGPSRSGAV